MIRSSEAAIPRYLLGLFAFDGGHLKLSTEDAIPKATCDTKPIVEVSKVMLEVILLELLVVERKAKKKII